MDVLTKSPFLKTAAATAEKKTPYWHHPIHRIILLRFKAVADRRQWSSAASKPRRKMRVKLCPHF